METLGNPQIAAAGLTDWRKLAQSLHARFQAPDIGTAGAFAARLTQLGVGQDHLRELRLVGTGVDAVVCSSDDGRWVTEVDLGVARQVSTVAAELGLVPDPAGVTQVELGLDAVRGESLAPFWAALLTGSAEPLHGEVFHPTDRLPNVWFQGTAPETTRPHETPRQRWHLDVWVAPEVASERITAALAAGGTLVDDSEAPSFVVLADLDGNRACICTSLDRS